MIANLINVRRVIYYHGAASGCRRKKKTSSHSWYNPYYRFYIIYCAMFYPEQMQLFFNVTWCLLCFSSDSIFFPAFYFAHLLSASVVHVNVFLIMAFFSFGLTDDSSKCLPNSQWLKLPPITPRWTNHTHTQSGEKKTLHTSLQCECCIYACRINSFYLMATFIYWRSTTQNITHCDYDIIASFCLKFCTIHWILRQLWCLYYYLI